MEIDAAEAVIGVGRAGAGVEAVLGGVAEPMVPIAVTLPRASCVTVAPPCWVSRLRPSTLEVTVPAAGASCAKASLERVLVTICEAGLHEKPKVRCARSRRLLDLLRQARRGVVGVAYCRSSI